MTNFKVDASCIGKTIHYLDKNGKPHSNRVIGVNVKKNYFRVIGDFPSDVPMKIFPRFVDNITGETSITVCPVDKKYLTHPDYKQFFNSL